MLGHATLLSTTVAQAHQGHQLLNQLPSLGEAHPNPASETMTLTYRLPAGTATASFALYDLTRRRVASQALAETQGEAQLVVQTLAAGLYLAVLEANGRTLATRKLSVTH